jgi:tetratricopeptide (TPR) repeat protein
MLCFCGRAAGALGCFLFLVLTTAGQTPTGPEYVSPQGKAYYAKPDTDGAIAKADAALAKNGPNAAERLIAAARARDAVQRFSESIPLYSRGIDQYPDDMRFRRYRGHRFLSLRRWDAALLDLKKAMELAPTSFDVSYHLALAYYFHGDFNHAAREYQRCLSMAAQKAPEGPQKGLQKGVRSCYGLADDSRVAMTEWCYLALRRAGKSDEAKKLLESIKEGMEVTDSQAYYSVLLFCKGLRTEAQILNPSTKGNQLATISYALGVYSLLDGKKGSACELFRKVLQGDNWAAFGFIASEVELNRGVCVKSK